MSIIALVVIGGIGLLVFIIFTTVKTKSTSINEYEPFKEWVGKTVTLNKETALFKDKQKMNPNRDYSYMLLDSLHPKWQYLEEQKAIGDLVEITRFPEGTILKFEKAIQYTNGVSGFSYPTIFGSITSNGKEYKTGYQWGEMDMAKKFDKVEKCWQFHQAPWQKEKDTAFYALPTASLW
ncbi:hypothetical protein SAMN05421741_12436 [Paenimyroides ummariense]|uniref:Uncharacterized protein n=1 Tax=Paenimyroides ummariense TaxID=913024 RepID=A0A1I5F369_9FLAO|nr:hypothetical protein [Paenimyroides ummariense]SFO18195.1 hypothetical protein SAMN05421741_12436 [Paenimyroides ummariense]